MTGAVNSDASVGPFFQATWKVAEQADIVTGGRYERFSADVKDPLTSPVVHDKIDVWIPNYNVSLVYKPTKTSSVYATYNYSKNTSGAVGNGGGGQWIVAGDHYGAHAHFL